MALDNTPPRAEKDEPPAPSGAVARATIVTEHEDFDALSSAWDDLWARSRPATAFQTHAWTSAWARAYVPPGRLAVACVWDGDTLVGAAALCRARHGVVRGLVPLGGDISDHTDVLLDPSVPDAGLRLVHALLDVPGWRVISLPEVLPNAAAHAWVNTWPGRRRRSDASLNLHLPATPVDQALTRVPSRTASTLRRKLRKIDQLGVERTEVAAADVARAVPGLIQLHEAQWTGRRGNPEHLTDRFGAFLTAALSHMVERGQAVFTEYRLDGELMAVEVDLVGHQQLAYYLAGISPALRERIDTAVLLVSSALELATRLGKPEYSFLRGDEDYKFRWRPDRVVASRWLLARPGVLGSAGYFPVSAAVSGVLAMARRMLRGRAKELARTVMHGVRILRARS